MDSDSHSTAIGAAVIAGGDRLSKLGDATLGHILSFLPADEAARSAALSRRFRHVFAYVHTVSLTEPPPEPDPNSDSSSDDDDCYSPGYSRPYSRSAAHAEVEAAILVPRRFINRVSAALLARLRLSLNLAGNNGGGGAVAAAGVPLRALRLGFEKFSSRPNAAALDMWLWHAMRGGEGGELEIHVDLGRRHRRRRCLGPTPVVCDRRYSLLRSGRRYPPPAAIAYDHYRRRAAAGYGEDDDGVYVAPRSVFTCAALRVLRLGSCRIDLPPPPSSAAAAGTALLLLPSLETLHLTEVTGAAVERLVAGCPRLASLTVEACAGVTALSPSPQARLRSLAIRCCHDLAAVTVADASALRTFHYRGAVPGGPSFLTLHNGGGAAISSCTLDFCGGEGEAMMDDDDPMAVQDVCGEEAAIVDDDDDDPVAVQDGCNEEESIMDDDEDDDAMAVQDGCGEEEAMTMDDDDDLVVVQQQAGGLGAMLLQVLVGVERLQLTSARLGCGVASLPAFPALAKLRHLELTGMLPDEDDGDGAAMNAVVKILEQAPNLETLTLFFMPEYYTGDGDDEEKDGNGHRLKYDERAPLAVPEGVELPCLRETMKEINFVHYQGGLAQRTLAKFLLCNAPGVREVCAEFASGPFFVQIRLMEEIKGWVMNKSANVMFF